VTQPKSLEQTTVDEKVPVVVKLSQFPDVDVIEATYVVVPVSLWSNKSFKVAKRIFGPIFQTAFLSIVIQQYRTKSHGCVGRPIMYERRCDRDRCLAKSAHQRSTIECFLLT
jgi:hypothetical protein